MKSQQFTRRAAVCLALGASALTLSAGCTSEYSFTILPGATCEHACTVSVGSRYEGTVAGENLGAAVEIAAWGYAGQPLSATLDKDKRTAASGAPDHTVSGARVGRVLLHEVSASNGTLTTSSAPQVLSAPATGTREFGSALLAVDVRSGHSTVTQVGQFLITRAVAWGEEILVGAPGTSNNAGAVYWYQNQGSHTVGWSLGGTLTAPTPRDSARFGASFAAPYDLDARSTAAPAWIAVGAPGEGRVYIYLVLPGLAQPFVPLQELVGPANTDFGTSLAIADFNNDGRLDLAVGAPRDSSGGRVRVFRGIAGFTPVSAGDPLVIPASGPLVGGGEFGAALAAGKIRGSSTALPGFVVGAPGFDSGGATNRGGLCQYQLRDQATLAIDWSRCNMNPVAQDEERYGHAVAIGNFAAPRAGGDFDGSCASGDEIAVGIPGRSRPSPSTSNSGAVHILGRGENGGDPLATGRMIYGGEVDQFTGRALAADLVGVSDSEDLLIGSPRLDGSRGRVSLTRAVSPTASDPISGEWRSTDSAGATFRVYFQWDAANGSLSSTMLRNQRLTFRNNGAVCSYLGTPLDGSGRLTLPTIPWATTAASHAENVTIDVSALVGFAATASGTLTFNAAASTFTLAINESAGVLGLVPAACNITGNPFVFTRFSAPTCD